MKKYFVKSLIILIISIVSFSNVYAQLTDLVQKSEKAIFTILTYDKYGSPSGIGTGFFIDSKGTGITNYHVLDGAYKAFIKLNENTKFEIDQILSANPDADLIKFSINNPSNTIFSFLTLSSTIPQKGQSIFVIGNPEGLESTVSEGIVSSIRDLENFGNVIQITAPISPGSSGSPIMTMDGEVVAVASFQLREGQNLNFGIETQRINDLITLTKPKQLSNFNSEVLIKQTSAIKYIDPANMDLSVKPGDNFYLYANGTWLKNNPVPASKTRWGSFDILYQASLEKLRDLCEYAAANTGKSSIYQRVGDLYASAMDSSAIESLGYTPIKSELARLNTLTSIQEVMNEIATLRTKALGGGLFGFRVDQDDKNVNQYIPTLSQGGTSLPDRDYYLKNDSRSQTIRAEYLAYVAGMFKLTGDDSVTAATKAADIMALETGLAKAQLSRVELRDPVKTYNKFSLADFAKTTPGIDWKAMFTAMKVANADSLLVNNPTFFKTADALLSAVPLDTWKAYLQWSVIKNSAAYLSDAFVQRQFQFNKVLSGQKQITPRWQRMSSLTDGGLGELLGQLYVEKYFNDSAKQKMLALVKNIQETFAARIQRLDWMSDATKQQALIKLNTIVNKIGFPDKWETYDGVVINKNDLTGNVRSVNIWAYNKMVNQMGKPVDKTEWGMTPPTINAYYNPANNEIAFPAGILQFPFFDFGADDAVNYGGIAAVIGHELTHGFDDQGRQYAADGNLKDWWTEADAKQFDARAQKVVEEYNGFVVNDSLHVNGELTLGENLADLGGISIAYEAFKKTGQGESGKKIDGFTPDQRFFLSWAQVWRSNSLPETAAQRILTDPHSPGMYRCNGPIVNMDAFYKAFNIQPADKMYKPEAERIKVW